MNFKTTYLLLGILALLLVVLAVVLYVGPTPPPGAGFILSSMRDKKDPVLTEQVDKVTVEVRAPAEGSPSTIVFQRDSDKKGWRITEPRETAADSSQVNGLVDQLRDARFEEDTKAESFSKAGLTDPKRVITLTKGDREWKVYIGATTRGEETGLAYVSTSDYPGQALAVTRSKIEKAFQDVDYFRNKDLLGREMADIQSLKLSDGKKVVELKKSGDRWTMVQPPYGEAELGNLIQQVTDLSVHYKDGKDSDFVADAVTDLAAYHLDESQPTLRIEVGRGEEGKGATKQAVVVGTGKKVLDATKKTEDRYYAYVATDSQAKDVVRVEAKNVEPFIKLLANPESVRNKTLVQITGTPDAIDIENSYGKLEFRRLDNTKPWELYRGGSTGSNVEEAELQLLLSTLTKKDQVQSFPDPGRRAELGLAKDRKVDATVSVYTASLEKPEKSDKPSKPGFKKDAKPVVTLRFGNRERGSVAVERIAGDESTLVMVPEAVRDLVGKSPLAYLDKSLPKFAAQGVDPSADVTKVVIERNGTTYEVSRDKPTEPWKLTKPDTLKGREANARVVEDLLMDLNRVKAVEIAEEKASDDKLASDFDLKAAPYKVTITVSKDGKATSHVYHFGREVPGKGYYAKLGDRDTVYVVGGEVVGALKKDLQDPTVFKFDPSKVQSIKLSGWKKLLGGVTVRLFERKEGKWIAKEPANYNLDAAKLDDFVRSLSNLQAEKFTPSGKGLDLNQDALEIEVKVEGRAEPLQLLLGDKEGASYFASSKQLKGDVFTVPAGPFDGLRAAPGFFGK